MIFKNLLRVEIYRNPSIFIFLLRIYETPYIHPLNRLAISRIVSRIDRVHQSLVPANLQVSLGTLYRGE